MSDRLIDRGKDFLVRTGRSTLAVGGLETRDLVVELVSALEEASSYKSLPPGMVWQDYYSPDDVLKIREPLDAEIERLRAGGTWVEHVETVRALQQSHHGACICDCNPETTNGPEEYCSHHGRPYYEVVDRLTAKIEQLIQERLTFTDKLGYGDGVTEPAAELAELLDPIKAAFSEQRDHWECPRMCEQCGERLASTVCPECQGSGCNAPACEASGAYAECEYCAGVGWVHDGCAEASYADLADEVKKLRGTVERVHNIAAHTAIGGWENALLEIEDLTVGIEKP